MTVPFATARAVIFALFLSIPALAAAVEPNCFVTGMGDVPAMPALSAAENGALVFDKPAGRIVETTMQGQVGRKAVLDFYRQTMPQLGWKRITDSLFEREGEQLHLEFPSETAPAQAGRITVQFVLIPR